jgi:hypothetical protein
VGGQSAIEHASLGPRAEADGPGRSTADAVAIVSDVEAAAEGDYFERMKRLVIKN